MLELLVTWDNSV